MSKAPKTLLRGAALLGLLLLAAVAWAEAPAAGVLRINDGDTITVRLGGKSELVRLIGVDAPETSFSKSLARKAKQAGRSLLAEAQAGAASRAALEGMVQVGDTVHLLDGRPQSERRDRYGRRLAFVYLADGRLLNLELIAQGWARAYRSFDYRHKRDFLEAEKQARQARRGLWEKGGAYDLERRTGVSPSKANSRP